MSRGFRRSWSLWLLVLTMVGFAGCTRAPKVPKDEQVARAIRAIVEADTLAGGAARATYVGRAFRPLWWEDGLPAPRALALVDALLAARSEGLDPGAYRAESLATEVRRRDVTEPKRLHFDADSLASLDLALSVAALACARDAAGGRVADSALDADWRADRAARAPADVLADPERTASVLLAGAPREAGYQDLRSALQRLRSVAERGGWPRVTAPAGEARDAEVRARLAAGGELAQVGAGPIDDAVVSALKAFQRRHGLIASGRADSSTIREMNVPVERRIRQVELNMERRRWLPASLGDRRVEVNLPDYRLAAFDSGRRVLELPVMIGRRKTPTPVFSDAIAFIELHPTWTVPRRIIVEEIVPALRRNPAYLARMNMQVLRPTRAGLTPVSEVGVPWSAALEDTFRYFVRQGSGPTNPLGRIKFMCPNEYDVYLHDTSNRRAFGAHARAFSHGCVRVQNPAAFGAFLMQGTRLGGRDSMLARIAGDAPERVVLPRSVPVHFLYWTAWVDSAGALQFRDDLYGIDARLDSALTTGAEFVLNPNVPIAGAKPPPREP